MENFPANSDKLKKQPKEVPEDKPEKNIQKVTEGVVIKKPKGIGRRFKDIFFDGNFKGAALYVATDVLWPGVKNITYDMGNSMLERSIFGENGGRRTPRFGDPRAGRFSYDKPAGRSAPSRSHGGLLDRPVHGQAPMRRRHDAGEILLVSREEADVVLEQMADILDTYDIVSVADLYELVGLPSTHVDNKWGWSTLHTANVRQTREGFLLDLPPIEPI